MNSAFGQVSPSSTRRDPSAPHVSCRPARAVAVLVAWVMLAIAPAVVHAHASLDEAIQYAEDADFDAAIASFDAAIASGELTRDELVLLLSERALVFHALGNDSALGRDLSLLAMLAPDRELGRAAPPPLVARWNELRASQGAALSVHGTCGPSPSGTEIAAQVEGLRDGELGQVFIHTRDASGEWVQKQAASVDIPSGDDGVSYYIQILGPGGIALASQGSASAPLECAPLSDPAPMAAGVQVDASPRRSKKMWWWIGGAAVLVAAGSVTAAMLLTRDDTSDRTSVSKPMVSF